MSSALYSIDAHLTHQQQTALENIMQKEEIAHDEQFLLIPQCFLLKQKIVSPFVNIFDIISLFAAELEEPKIDMLGKRFKGFYRFCGKGFTVYHTISTSDDPM